MINDSYYVLEAEQRGLPVPSNSVERFIFAVSLTNENEDPWISKDAGLVRWDMLNKFDTAYAVTISYNKRDDQTLKFLKRKIESYDRDPSFQFEFVHWTIENFKGPWTYSVCTIGINLIFKYKEDAVFFRLAWMDNK